MAMSEKRSVNAHFPESEFERMQNWRRAQADLPPLAEAVRTLVDLGLKASAEVDQKRPSAKDSVA
jgi:hypothetical protein